jgi:hypothetical protein
MIATPPRSACVTKTSQQTLKSKIKALNIDTASFSSTLIVQQMPTAPDTGQRSGEAGAGGDLPGPPHSEQKIAEFDGFIICTAEYNHGLLAVADRRMRWQSRRDSVQAALPMPRVIMREVPIPHRWQTETHMRCRNTM